MLYSNINSASLGHQISASFAELIKSLPKHTVREVKENLTSDILNTADASMKVNKEIRVLSNKGDRCTGINKSKLFNLG